MANQQTYRQQWSGPPQNNAPLPIQPYNGGPTQNTPMPGQTPGLSSDASNYTPTQTPSPYSYPQPQYQPKSQQPNIVYPYQPDAAPQGAAASYFPRGQQTQTPPVHQSYQQPNNGIPPQMRNSTPAPPAYSPYGQYQNQSVLYAQQQQQQQHQQQQVPYQLTPSPAQPQALPHYNPQAYPHNYQQPQQAQAYQPGAPQQGKIPQQQQQQPFQGATPDGPAGERGLRSGISKFWKGSSTGKKIAMGLGGALVAGFIGVEAVEMFGDSAGDIDTSTFGGGDVDTSGFGGDSYSGGGGDYSGGGGDSYSGGGGGVDYSEGGYDYSNELAAAQAAQDAAAMNAIALQQGIDAQEAAIF